MSTALLLLLAVDPVALARQWPKTGWLLAPAALGVSALAADTVLDALDLSPEAFWISAGILLIVPGFALLGRGDHRDAIGPAAVVVTMAYATRDGVAETLLGVALVAVVTLLSVRFRPAHGTWVGRAFGAAMVVLAFDLVRDGVIAV